MQNVRNHASWSDMPPVNGTDGNVLNSPTPETRSPAASSDGRETSHVSGHGKKPSKRNKNANTGNIGFYLFNYGTRSVEGSNRDNAERRAVRHTMDNHSMKNAGQITIGLECNMEVARLLQAPAVAGSEHPREKENGGKELDDRATKENHVVRIPDDGDGDSIVVAAVKTLFSSLELLYSEHCPDKTRILICKAILKQPIGYLGGEIIIFAFHGNRNTMKIDNQGTYTSTWDKVADLIEEYDVQIFAGDFNMALMNVRKELRCRELTSDCIAYYPWGFTRDFRSASGHYIEERLHRRRR